MNNTQRVFENSYLKPVARLTVGKHEVFIADGLLPVEQYKNFENLTAIPISREEHPSGCFVTVWRVPGKIADRCGASVFARDHDAESLALDARQAARIRRTVNECAASLARA